MTDDETLVTLSPSAEMTILLGELSAALERLKSMPRPAARAFAFEDLPVLQFSRAAARFYVLSEQEDRSPSALLHHLSQELGIMSAMDLHQRFRSLAEGTGVASLWRTVQNARSIETLLRNDIALGWGGFDTLPAADNEQRTTATRRRMMADYYRDAVDWTALRALDLTRAGELILDALDADMISEHQASWWLRRTVAEAVVRAGNWNEWAASMLMGRVFEALASSVEEAREIIRRDGLLLEELLGAEWRETPWPRLRSEAAES